MIQSLSKWTNSRSGEILIVALSIGFLKIISYVPYINLVSLWFGWTFVAILIVIMFRISSERILLFSSLALLGVSLLIMLRFDYLAEHITILLFNLIIFSFLRLFITYLSKKE